MPSVHPDRCGSRAPSWRAALRAFAAATLALLLAACAEEPSPPAAAPHSHEAPAQQAASALPGAGLPEPAVQYVCPMHPQVVADQPGRCPICGMDLVARELAPAPAADRREVLYWYDPMRPEVHFDAPGPSPFMDMALVPRYADEAVAGAVAVPAAVQQSLGVRVERVERQPVAPSVRAPAQVVTDARAEVRLAARVDGWIERLQVRAEGDTVARGDVVAEIYAPELVAAQEELLLDIGTRAAARERLLRFGIAEADIDAVLARGSSQRRLPLRAPASGVVTMLGVREGGRVDADTVIMDIAARDRLWLEARVFPAQLPLLGQSPSARFTLPGAPEQAWRAEAAYIEPAVDAATQTVAIRFPVEQDTGVLPLGAWLDATLYGPPRPDVLTLPADAVIRTGDGAHVVQRVAPDRFAPVPVSIGREYDGRIEVREGLQAGDEVVVSGQFLIDSEANLRGGLQRLGAGSADRGGAASHEATGVAEDPHAGHAHGGDATAPAAAGAQVGAHAAAGHASGADGSGGDKADEDGSGEDSEGGNDDD